MFCGCKNFTKLPYILPSYECEFYLDSCSKFLPIFQIPFSLSYTQYNKFYANLFMAHIRISLLIQAFGQEVLSRQPNNSSVVESCHFFIQPTLPKKLLIQWQLNHVIYLNTELIPLIPVHVIQFPHKRVLLWLKALPEQQNCLVRELALKHQGNGS